MSHWFFMNFNWGLHNVKARFNMHKGLDKTQHVKPIITSMSFIIQNKSNKRIVLFYCNGRCDVNARLFQIASTQ